jgi:hypothetical protein
MIFAIAVLNMIPHSPVIIQQTSLNTNRDLKKIIDAPEFIHCQAHSSENSIGLTDIIHNTRASLDAYNG